jgi:hypothetical protein
MSKSEWGMDHECKISSANCTPTSCRVDASVVASRGGVLDDVPSWIDDNSERDRGARRNRDDGTSRFTRGTDARQETPNNGQGLACSSVGEAESSSDPGWGNGGTSHLT